MCAKYPRWNWTRFCSSPVVYVGLWLPCWAIIIIIALAARKCRAGTKGRITAAVTAKGRSIIRVHTAVCYYNVICAGKKRSTCAHSEIGEGQREWRAWRSPGVRFVFYYCIFLNCNPFVSPTPCVARVPVLYTAAHSLHTIPLVKGIFWINLQYIPNH